mgnify:CR=1 FL=1
MLSDRLLAAPDYDTIRDVKHLELLKAYGQDLRDVTQESLRAAIGMVTQDTSLLHRSVRDNILYGRPDAPDTAMEEAARRAEAHDFICGLADAKGRTGYDAHVGERGRKRPSDHVPVVAEFDV